MFIMVSLYQVPEVTPTSTEAITSCNSLLVSCGAILEDSKVNLLDDENQYNIQYPPVGLPLQYKRNTFIPCLDLIDQCTNYV